MTDNEYTTEQVARFRKRCQELCNDLSFNLKIENGILLVYDNDVLLYAEADSLEVYGWLVCTKHDREHPKVLEGRGNDVEELTDMATEADKRKEALYRANKKRGEREDQP